MKETSFRWYLRKLLMAATPSKTLDLRILGELAKYDSALRAALMLHVTGSVSRERAGRRLGADAVSDYGKFFFASGKPSESALADMPRAYREVYESYQAYLGDRETRRRVKILCRSELLELMFGRGLSLRDIGRAVIISIGCISRFLNGCDYAISADKLKQIVEMLGGNNVMDNAVDNAADNVVDNAVDTAMENTKGTTMNTAMNTLQIKDYSERKLDDGMVEITFTLVMTDNVADALNKVCQVNNVTLSELVTLFLHWMAEHRDEAVAWLKKTKKGNAVMTEGTDEISGREPVITEKGLIANEKDLYAVRQNL